MKYNSDRRRFPRHRCTGAAEILQSGKCWGWGTVSDISRSGCYIETTHPLPFGTEAQLRLTIADIELGIFADVVSTDLLFGMGMSFMAVSPEQEINLAQIIEKVAELDVTPAVQQKQASHEEAQLTCKPPHSGVQVRATAEFSHSNRPGAR